MAKGLAEYHTIQSHGFRIHHRIQDRRLVLHRHNIDPKDLLDPQRTRRIILCVISQKLHEGLLHERDLVVGKVLGTAADDILFMPERIVKDAFEFGGGEHVCQQGVKFVNFAIATHQLVDFWLTR